MTDAAIVRDTEGKGALGTFAAKSWQGAPDRDHDVLKQIVTFGRIARVARGDAAERCAMGREQVFEAALKRTRQSAPGSLAGGGGQLVEAERAAIRHDCVNLCDIRHLS